MTDTYSSIDERDLGNLSIYLFIYLSVVFVRIKSASGTVRNVDKCGSHLQFIVLTKLAEPRPTYYGGSPVLNF